MTLPFTLMVVTDDGPDLEARIARVLSAHTSVPICLQLRMKHAARRELTSLAVRVRLMTREKNIPLLINGRIDVALEVEAEGVQLPSAGLSIAVARALLPATALIGVSCHTSADVERAAGEGASYALLSPIRHVTGKAPPLGVEGFAAVAQQNHLPLLALGGVTRQDVAALRAAGAAGIAVMRSVMLAPHPSAAVVSFCQAWEGYAP